MVFPYETPNLTAKYCSKTKIIMRTALFWVITRQLVVISYRRFGTTYRSHSQGWRTFLLIQQPLFLHSRYTEKNRVFFRFACPVVLFASLALRAHTFTDQAMNTEAPTGWNQSAYW